jgi:hypothetical protein
MAQTGVADRSLVARLAAARMRILGKFLWEKKSKRFFFEKKKQKTS